MEENVQEIKLSKRELFIKLLPYIITTFVTLIIGMSFIGNFFIVTHYEGELEVINNVSLSTLLFASTCGVSAQIYFLLLYLIFPAISCIFLIFSKFKKNLLVVSLLLFLLIAVASIVTKDVYATAIKYYFRIYYGVKYSFDIDGITFQYYLPTIVYFVSFGLTLMLSTNEIKFQPRDITEMGVLIAAAVGLNFIKILPMPTGGSINLQMLPLFLLALRRGAVKGFIGGGIVFGLITCLTDGYGFATYPFDYLIGFGSIAVFGQFSKFILPDGVKTYTLKGELFLLLAGILSTSLRFAGGTVSSMVIYGYDFIAAATYNAAYIFASGGIALAIVMALLGPIARVNALFPVQTN